MNTISRFLTAIAFSVAGAAAHASAAVEQNACGSSTCFQLTPVAQKGADAFLAEDGYNRTPQGQVVAENGASHTSQGKWLEEHNA
ncbi:hypothetical protein PSUM_00910 [Pseudomonas umsongensis]|uniref:Peptidase inhibitor family I36 n=1 Tax=Pseudomonas umsongensis TaxID=198618 RepID=A0ABX4DZ89_9PSED|nr:hypothetical protein [Pseudomonas umsongensis]OXR34497.1 hypothetical protein PSUM_00910 [Pseudomonas umsongensis]SDS93656.1 hypothetical protein SAMN04490206_1737 [Pseudomonas umsongensis]